MKNLVWLCLIWASAALAQAPTAPPSPEGALETIRLAGEKIPYDDMQKLAVSQNGRIKPFDSLARETILFVTGRYNKLG